VGILHDLALLDLAVLLKEAADLGLLEARVDAGDEEVGAGVDGALIVLVAAIVLDGSTRWELAGGPVCVARGHCLGRTYRSLPLGDIERRRESCPSSRRGDALRSRS